MVTTGDIQRKAREDQVSAALVFKELVQVTVLDHLFRQGAFSGLVFQGGTALRLMYQGVRYSEDLDFVLRKKNDPVFTAFGETLAALPAHMERVLPFVRAARLKEQKSTATFRRHTLVLETDFLDAHDRTNIELANVPAHQGRPVMFRHSFLASTPALVVEPPGEILADKFVAFAARDYIKGRDLWDMFFLLDTLRVAMTDDVLHMVRQKMADYGLVRTAMLTALGERTVRLEKEGAALLRAEMDRFLPFGHREMFRPRYADICRDIRQVLGQLIDELKA